MTTSLTASMSPKIPVERRARASQRRALVKVGYSCNDHCVFCHTDDYRHSGDASTEAIQRKVALARAQGFDMVVFSGGEATIRPDLFAITKEVARRGLLLGFITNGRVMSYQHVVRKLLAHNLRYVHLSLHGTERVHNKLTGDRSFVQTYQGLQNLVGRGLDLTVNCVVTRQNLASLRDLVELLAPYADVLLKFSCCEPKGAALRHEEAVVPPVADAARAVVDAIRHGLGDPACRLSFAVENFPFCHLDGLHELDDDLEANRLFVMSEVWDEGLVDIDDFNKVKPPACAGCAHYESCPGLFVEYVARFSDRDARPVADGGAQSVRSAGAYFRGVPARAAGSPLPPAPFRAPEQARIDRHPRHPDTALLTLFVPGCDQQCLFCDVPQQGIRARPSTANGVRASLRAMAPHASSVYFTGGEPSQLPWFLDAVRYARQLGFQRVAVQTHGGALHDAAGAAGWAEAGVTQVDMPLYGADAQTHQAITRTPGSFRRTMAALQAARRAGVRVQLHNTVFRANLRGLADWLDFVGSADIDGAYVQLAGDLAGTSEPRRHAPTWSEWEAELRAVRHRWPTQTPVVWADATACLAPELSIPRLPHATGPTGAIRSKEAPDSLIWMPYDDWLWAFTAGASHGWQPACDACSKRPMCHGPLAERWAQNPAGPPGGIVLATEELARVST